VDQICLAQDNINRLAISVGNEPPGFLKFTDFLYELKINYSLLIYDSLAGRWLMEG